MFSHSALEVSPFSPPAIVIIYRQGHTYEGTQVTQRAETSPMICICGATPIETFWINKGICGKREWAIGSARFVKGTYLKHPVLLVQSGIGRRNMHRALSNLPDDRTIGSAINIGCTGALVPAMKVAHLNIPREIRLHPEGSVETVSEAMFMHARSAAGAFRMGRVHFRPSATVNTAFDREQKHALRLKAPDIGCIDLESYHFARFFAQRGIPCLVARGISDTYNAVLPPVSWCDPSCWRRWHRMGIPSRKLLCTIRFHIALLMACWMNRRFVDHLLYRMPPYGG